MKPGGRLVVADGFVNEFDDNEHPIIRKWLDGWQVNYLETAQRFGQFMSAAGFGDIAFTDISRYTAHSSRRLLRMYYLASLYIAWKKITFADRSTEMQRKNIEACKYQYRGLKKGLWQYGIVTGKKP